MKIISFPAAIFGNFAEIFLKVLQGFMNALILAAGVGLLNENRFKNWLQKIVKQMMDDPITESGGKNFSDGRIGNDETDRTARRVAVIPQFAF